MIQRQINTSMNSLQWESAPRAVVGQEVGASINIERKDFSINNTPLCVLEDIQLEVMHKEFVTILGPSGCGKTTLLRIIAGLDNSYEGAITVHGKRVDGAGLDRGLVFQESRLLPWFSVWRNVAFALPKEMSKSEKLRKVMKALKLVGLSDFGRAWPYQLSGGMAKRVALARALVNLPSLLLLDEPFGALDSLTKFSMQTELERIHMQSQLTTVMVTHDVDEAIYLSDRIVILASKPGRIQHIIDVPLARPRDRASIEFARIRSSLLKEIL